MNYIKFRYTFPEGCNPDINAVKQLFYGTFKKLTGEDTPIVTAGIEKLNKLNEPTHTHIHIHIKTIQKQPAVRTAFKSWIEKECKTETRKGNALYSIKQELDVEDDERFFRYCWKQNRCKWIEKGTQDWDTKTMEACAKEEQERMWEFNKKQQAKQLRKNTKDLLMDYLDNQHLEKPYKDDMTILVDIIKYYDAEGKSANENTIMGYLQTALWRFKLEKHKETAKKWLSRRS